MQEVLEQARNEHQGGRKLLCLYIFVLHFISYVLSMSEV